MDSLNRTQAGLGYTALFGLDAVLLLLAAVAISRVPATLGHE